MAILIQDTIQLIVEHKEECSVMLTGGRNAEKLFAVWTELPAFQQTGGVQFYFGDERCVPPDSVESNYGMAMRTLFQNRVPPGCSVFRMEADDPDHEAAAQRYAEILPDKIDVVLLGVGEDGHIASLFPGSAALQESRRRIVPVTGPKPPSERLTITPAVISQARSIFVLAAGPGKAKVLTKAKKAPSDVATLPARLVLTATWLLDSVVAESG